MTGKAVRLTMLGIEMRKARKEAGLSLKEVASMLGVRFGTVSRWENNERKPQPTYFARYASIVNMPKDIAAELMKVVQAPQSSPWVSVGETAQSEQLSTVLELERRASSITIVSPMLIPGLLQTADYIRAMLSDGGVPAAEIEPAVILRIGRQSILLKEDGPQLLAITTEASIMQNVGGPQVMAAQLRHLTSASKSPNVEFRIVPFESGWSPILDGPFALMGSKQRAPAVQTENGRSSLFFDEPGDIDFYQARVEKILRVSLSPESSRERIEARIKQLEQIL